MSSWVTDVIPQEKYQDFINHLHNQKKIKLQNQLLQIKIYKNNFDKVIKEINNSNFKLKKYNKNYNPILSIIFINISFNLSIFYNFPFIIK